MPDTLLATKGLTVAHGRHTVVRDVDIEVRAGEMVVLLGANGAGKTSLLQGIVGAASTPVGTVTYQGQDVTNSAPEKLARRGLLFVPERREIFRDIEVMENLRVSAESLLPRRERAAAIERALEIFPQLRERTRLQAGSLSGGQQQMLAIALAIVGNPRVLLLDEPALGIAPVLAEQMFESITKFPGMGIAVLLVEPHAHLSLAIADRGYVMSGGRIAMSGTAEELQSEPLVEAYLGVS